VASVGSVVAVVGGGVVSVVVGSVSVEGGGGEGLEGGSFDGVSVVVGSSEPVVGSVVGSVSLVGGPGSVRASLSSLLLTSFAASLEVFPPPLCPPAEERRRKRRQRESDNKTAILTAADLVEPRRKMRHGVGGARVLLLTQKNGTSPSGMYPAFQ
jgi:hypothetical protein